ncbi:MAG TPA: hypothetical protein VMU54_16855 [Planctomycetota bacterium]|nr:hypothetical protein [Planctomycetota bacterium]
MYLHEIRDQGSFLILKGSGVLSGRELIETTRKLIGAGDAVRLVRFTLVLFDEVATVEVSADDVRRLVEVDKVLMKLIPRRVIAIVAPQDELFGLSRMWEMLVGVPGWETRVFRSRPEADAWLAAARKPTR